jgi:hypothetical protein
MIKLKTPGAALRDMHNLHGIPKILQRTKSALDGETSEIPRLSPGFSLG